MPNILDYNRAVDQYKQTGNIQPVNTVLSQFNAIPGNTAYNQPYSTNNAPATSAPVQDVLSASQVQTPTEPAIDENVLNSIYQPGIDVLNKQQDLLTNTLLPNQLQSIGNTKQKALSSLDLGLNQYNSQLDESRDFLGKQQQSALAQAARDFQALQQRNMALFGGQSSAAGAHNEILSSEFLRTRGGINDSYGTSLGNLMREQSQYLMWDRGKRALVESDAAEAERKAQSEYQEKLLELANNRAMLESAKQAKKMEILQSHVNRILDIRDYKLQKQADLDALAAQYNMQLEAQMNRAVQNHVQFINSNPFAGTNQITYATPQVQASKQQFAYFPFGTRDEYEQQQGFV